MYGPLFTHKIKEIYMISLKDIEKELKEIKKNTGLELEVKNFNSSKADEIYQQLTYINRAYKEKYDRDYVLKNILEGNISEEIRKQAKSFGVTTAYKYNVILIDTKESDTEIICQVIKQLFSVNLYNYVVPVEENRVVLIHSVRSGHERMKVNDIAHIIVDTINTEAMIAVNVSYSDKEYILDELHDAYEKAITALFVGEMYYCQNNVHVYQKIGIGEMICGISDDVSDRFLETIPYIGEISKLDPELISAINCFFDNNLNIAETSRQFHMHRNTLVYRIEQIEKKTGFDIRKFEDALTLRLVLMILRYRQSGGKDRNDR